MKKLFLLLVFVFCTLLIAGQSTAITLSFSPASQEITMGDSTTVDLIISGLVDATELGAFGIEILYDAAFLSFDSVMYGSLLGDTDPIALETDIDTQVGSGSVFLDELSWLLSDELDALQPDSFTLASLEFTGTAVGTSFLGFGVIDLSDAGYYDADGNFYANTLSYEELLPGEIKVAPVPEPATIMLLAGGFGGLAVFRKRILKK